MGLGGQHAPGGTSVVVSDRIGHPTWTRRAGTGRRPAIRQLLVSMRTPFPKSPDTAGVTISTRPPEPCSRSRLALFSIAHAWSYRLRSGKTALTRWFRSIPDYDGMPMEERSGGTVVSNARASIDHLSVSTLSLNAYYDFPDAVRGISPYLGVGLGPAFVEVAGLHFSTDYEDTSGNAQAYDPPLSFYNSRQDADLSDTVLAGHLHAGADYGLNANTLLGLKLTYSMMGDIESSGGYSLHPFHERDPDLPNHNTFTGARYWTLALTVKRLFGN